MSVLARLRGVSRYEFYSNALKLRKALVFLLLRDFGVKRKVRDLGIRTKPMDEETTRRFVAIAVKYDMPAQLAEYPEWIAGEAKNAIEQCLAVWTAEMTDEEREEFLGIALSYGVSCLSSDYPDWLLAKLREDVFDTANAMVHHITAAYSIWPTCEGERQERRVNQDRAIADCEALYKAFDLVLDVLPINADKFLPYAEQIEREIALLKGWRKGDNKRQKKK